MRKAIVLLAVLWLISAASSASAADVFMGFKGGINITDMTGSDVPTDSTDARYGFIGGIFFDIRVHERFSLQPELLFSMKGFSMDVDGIDVGLELNYVQIPVLLKLHPLLANDAVDPSIYAGPVLGVNVKSEVVGEENGVSVGLDVSDMTKDFEFSLVIGAGLDITAGPGYIVIDLRYDYGLTSIDDSGGDEDIKNWALGIMVGYGFAL